MVGEEICGAVISIRYAVSIARVGYYKGENLRHDHLCFKRKQSWTR